MKKISLYISFWILICLGIFINCDYETLVIPRLPDSASTIFDPGKVKYIPLNPRWAGSPWNFNHPTDIFISIDDYIFIADSGNSRIIVLDKTGNIVEEDEFGNDFSVLSAIPDVDAIGAIIKPVGIAVDPKLNLFIVSNSDNVYVWNQYVNNIGIDSVATAIVYKHKDTGLLQTITNFLDSYNLENQGYQIDHAVFEYDMNAVDSIMAPHIFYDDNSDGLSRFVSVVAAPFGFNRIHVADEGQQRIATLNLKRSTFVKLKNGISLWQHRGYWAGNAATAGTGAGTVNNPSGMCVDSEDNIYYTQLGENFGFHKIKELPSEEDWISVFTLGKNQILDLERFLNPYDVAIDDDGHIFVLNTGMNEIQQFDDQGKFIRKAGLREIQVDTTIVDTVITQLESSLYDTSYSVRDTIFTRYYNDILNHPEGIFVDDGVIYVVDSGNNQILRFKLSSDIDIEIPE